MPGQAVFLGITKRFIWTVCSVRSDPVASEVVRDPVSVVSVQRFVELGPRLQGVSEGTGLGGRHQVFRFNLLNLGDEQVTVCAIALTSAGRDRLQCEVVPPVVVRAGARYPFTLELREGLGSEVVDLQVERAPDDRLWVSAAGLPSPVAN